MSVDNLIDATHHVYCMKKPEMGMEMKTVDLKNFPKRKLLQTEKKFKENEKK